MSLSVWKNTLIRLIVEMLRYLEKVNNYMEKQASEKMRQLLTLLGVGWENECIRQKRCRFDSWIGKMPWKRAWQPTPVFLPGESHGQRSLANYSPQGHKESDMTEVT